MLKWFSLSGISKEVKRIRWPKTSEMALNTGEVLLFVCSFMLFFVLCDMLVSFGLRFIGIGA